MIAVCIDCFKENYVIPLCCPLSIYICIIILKISLFKILLFYLTALSWKCGDLKLYFDWLYVHLITLFSDSMNNESRLRYFSQSSVNVRTYYNVTLKGSTDVYRTLSRHSFKNFLGMYRTVSMELCGTVYYEDFF